MLTTEKKKYTVADYELLEEGAPFQLINYDLVMSPSPLTDHQLILGRIFIQLSSYLENKNNNGVTMFAPIDVHFDEGNIFQPDLVYVSENRKSIIKKYIMGAPDMVLEILSPSNAYYDLRQKKDIYERFGVQEYIIVDPIAQSAELYALKDGFYYLHQKAQKEESLSSIILDGLALHLNKIFK
ncbi:Uma2 family endonuclease [Mucilaginibacter koreensis]